MFELISNLLVKFSKNRRSKVTIPLFVRNGNKLYCVAGQGLGNRLKHLASAYYAAQYYNCHLCAWWLPDNRIVGKFEDLFQKVPFEINYGFPPAKLNFLQPGSWLWIPEEESFEGASAFPDNDFGGYCTGRQRLGAVRYFDYDAIPGNLKSKYLEIFSLFIPKEHIIEKNKKMIDVVTKYNMIGVHIRKTDMELRLKRDFGESDCPVNDSNFIRLMDEKILIDNQVKFFIASDSQRAIDRFASRYGERIFSLKNCSRNRDTFDSSIDAIRELILLSQCKYLIASYKSSFSEIAWWWGGCGPVEVPTSPFVLNDLT